MLAMLLINSSPKQWMITLASVNRMDCNQEEEGELEPLAAGEGALHDSAAPSERELADRHWMLGSDYREGWSSLD